MKKIFLMAAFAGLLVNTAVANTKGDDKGKDKKECKKDGKACAGDKKETGKDGEKACCKHKAESEKATKTTDKK